MNGLSNPAVMKFINDRCIDSYPNIVRQIEQTEDLLIRGAVVERACVCAHPYSIFLCWFDELALLS